VNYEAKLRTAIARAIADLADDNSLPQVCARFGLGEGDFFIGWEDKAQHVDDRLADRQLLDLIEIGESVLPACEGHRLSAFRLNEALRIARASGRRRISEVTRRNIFDELLLMGSIEGSLGIDDLLERLWPIHEMPSSDPRHKTFAGDLCQHMIMNSDWTQHDLLNRVGALELSDECFGQFMEHLVHPTVRQDKEQVEWRDVINKHLRRDGFALTESDTISGYSVYQIRPLDAGVEGAPKNLIFASNGPKPEILLKDAIHNDLQVVKNGEYCLFYDQAIPERGLLWRDLVAWWARSRNLDAGKIETDRSLYTRLTESLGSDPERWLFRSYFEFRSALDDRLPALIPQVYLHYDPKTVKELYGKKRLARQRMDFLLLLGHGCRIVIEVDGAQHYSSGDRPAPEIYAEMVGADRQLRLCGYEVYRFGGAEFPDKDKARTVVRGFFDLLFKKHQLQ